LIKADAKPKKPYKKALKKLQIELVNFQRHLIKNDWQILIILEGRDAAGKDGVIKRIVKHLSPRETRVVALGRPTNFALRAWYFERYVAHLPLAQQMVLMNRSWYNRAGVERVMGFCTDEEYEIFMTSVLPFEHLLVGAGMKIVKYYLDISKAEQEARLTTRKTDPLKQWKTSSIDDVALKKWQDYSAARNEMLQRTHNDLTPWFVVKADDKRSARLNVIRHFLSRMDWPEKDLKQLKADPEVVFAFNQKLIKDGVLAR